jgi:hypothetical protein
MPAQLPSGKTCASPVSGVEVAPTFFSFAGIDLPWEMHDRSHPLAEEARAGKEALRPHRVHGPQIRLGHQCYTDRLEGIAQGGPSAVVCFPA